MTPVNYEFYETPQTFTKYLVQAMATIAPIQGVLFEPSIGSGAIPRGFATAPAADTSLQRWITNDLDPRWPADFHLDARSPELWTRPGIAACGGIDWSVSNPAFTPGIDIIDQALKHSRVGVAMHLRASIHEVLKTGIRRTFLAKHLPTGILWLPRFAYQRSKATGKWSTDSVCACWVIWLKDQTVPQFIRYAPEWVIDELEAETPAYRTRMDALMATRAA